MDELMILAIRDCLISAKVGAMYAPRGLDDSFVTWGKAYARDVKFLLEALEKTQCDLASVRKELNELHEFVKNEFIASGELRPATDAT